MTPRNPLLAETADLNTLELPVWVFPKIDGVRGLPRAGIMYSRRLKPFPNRMLQRMTYGSEAAMLEGLDGEIILGSNPTAPGRLCNQTSGALMRASYEGTFTYWLFDIQCEERDFTERYRTLLEADARGMFPPWVRVIHGLLCATREEVEAEEDRLVAEGYEGVVLRHPEGRYKFGRSTLQQGLLLRLCRSARREAKVIGFVQALANENEKQISETGHTKRSSMQSGMRPKDTMGALRVVDIDSGEEFTVGTGFDHSLRKEIWEAQSDWMGALITYSFKPHGSERKPRHPVFVGRRMEIDL